MAEWWDSSWKKKRQVEIVEQTGNAVSDYPVVATVDIGSASADSIRVVDESSMTTIAHGHRLDSGSTYEVSFKVDLSANETLSDIYVYYENSSASSTNQGFKVERYNRFTDSGDTSLFQAISTDSNGSSDVYSDGGQLVLEHTHNDGGGSNSTFGLTTSLSTDHVLIEGDLNVTDPDGHEKDRVGIGLMQDTGGVNKNPVSDGGSFRENQGWGGNDTLLRNEDDGNITDTEVTSGNEYFAASSPQHVSVYVDENGKIVSASDDLSNVNKSSSDDFCSTSSSWDVLFYIENDYSSTDNCRMRWDWIGVRQRLSTEPSLTTQSEEQQQITNDTAVKTSYSFTPSTSSESATYELSGTVEVEGSLQQGAEVKVTDLTNDIEYDPVTTDSNGEFTVMLNDKGRLLISYVYDDGSTYWGDAEINDIR